jgi:superfamily II DNA or RNA helicase
MTEELIERADSTDSPDSVLELGEGVSSPDSAATLSPEEELQLQQLLQAKFWREKGRAVPHVGKRVQGEEPVPTVTPLPEEWELTKGVTLHDWQRHCVNAWFDNGRRGVIKVVTGAGKTILALAIAERLQREEVRNLRVAVVVPTTVLLEQWREEFAEKSNLPPEAVGLMGAGHDDAFDDRVRVLICVLNSASKKLAGVVKRAGGGDSLLLIVDECHRAGAAEMRRVFTTERAFGLGLSATPERDDEPRDENGGPDAEDEAGTPAFEDSVVGRELGDIIFELNYAEAIRLGVLPPFRIVHYGLSLRAKESLDYERISREIKELRAELETGTRRGLALIRWCRSRAASNNPKAARFVSLTGERKRLLYRMRERRAAVREVLRAAFAENPETKAILFHESIDEVMSLFTMLRRDGYRVVAEHSRFPDDMRAESLRLFRAGTAQVIVSARSLIEGFNVPSADLGIIVAASSSVRQRVQTLGRLLRKNHLADGTEKQAALYVLYASKTVDELIYERADWERFVGAERNEYYLWPDVSDSAPVPREAPPRSPAPGEAHVKAQDLQPGETYPGDTDEGRLYSLDMQGNVSDEQGNLMRPNAELRAVLANSRKKGGRFRVTPVNGYVVELEKTREGWRGVYLGRLTTGLEPAPAQGDGDEHARRYGPGDPYPLGKVRGKTFSVLQRDKRLIAIKTRDGVRFVADAETLEDAAKGDALRSVQRELARAYARGRRISKITVTPEGHVVYVFNGEAYFVGDAPEGAEGFKFEEKAEDKADDLAEVK